MWKCGVRVDPDNDSCQTLFKCLARLGTLMSLNGSDYYYLVLLRITCKSIALRITV